MNIIYVLLNHVYDDDTKIKVITLKVIWQK